MTGSAGHDGGAGTGAAGTSAAGTFGSAGTAAAGSGAAGDGTAGTIAPQAGTTGNPDAAADAPIDTTPDVVVASPDGSQNFFSLFNTSIDDWYFTKYGSTPSANDPNNLALLSGTPTWDATDDADALTTSGSLKGVVPFKHEGDRIDFQAFSSPSALHDWTGYKISAKVKVVSGGNLKAGCPLHAWIYISQAPDYATYPLSGVVGTDLVVGQWVTLTLDPADANNVNNAAISQLGIQITTGDACVGTVADGGTDASADGGVDAVTGTDGGTDAATDSSVADAAIDTSTVDGGTTDAVVDGAVIDADSGTIDTGSDAAPVQAVTAATAVILIDDVKVTVK